MARETKQPPSFDWDPLNIYTRWCQESTEKDAKLQKPRQAQANAQPGCQQKQAHPNKRKCLKSDPVRLFSGQFIRPE